MFAFAGAWDESVAAGLFWQLHCNSHLSPLGCSQAGGGCATVLGNPYMFRLLLITAAGGGAGGAGGPKSPDSLHMCFCSNDSTHVTTGRERETLTAAWALMLRTYSPLLWMFWGVLSCRSSLGVQCKDLMMVLDWWADKMCLSETSVCCWSGLLYKDTGYIQTYTRCSYLYIWCSDSANISQLWCSRQTCNKHGRGGYHANVQDH